MAIFIVLWAYLLTTKLRCLQKNNIGHTKVNLTLKKLFVEPDLRHPYFIFVCFAKSSTELIGVSILSMVRKAAKLAFKIIVMVYLIILNATVSRLLNLFIGSDNEFQISSKTNFSELVLFVYYLFMEIFLETI